MISERTNSNVTFNYIPKSLWIIVVNRIHTVLTTLLLPFSNNFFADSTLTWWIHRTRVFQVDYLNYTIDV